MDTRIRCIMDHFDFNKVYKVMKFLEWKYASVDKNGNVSERPPDLKMVKAKAVELMERTLTEGDGKYYYGLSSGGFKTRYFGNTETLSLEFVVTEWDSVFCVG